VTISKEVMLKAQLKKSINSEQAAVLFELQKVFLIKLITELSAEHNAINLYNMSKNLLTDFKAFEHTLYAKE
jgi:hypothetical protein